MESVLRGAAVFLVVFVLFRVFGKRTLSEITTFDLVMLLIVSEATQQALLGQDYSLIHALLVIATLIVLDRTWDVLAYRFPAFRNLAESRPLVLMRDGRLDRRAMRAAQVSEEDILRSARSSQGLENMDQIKHVVLEVSGGLSIIPK